MRKLTTAILLAILPSAALADDSSAALGAGGLELTKSAQIRMAAEDLAISPDSVHIRYAFLNDSNKDIDTLVAFPLPDIDAYEFWGSPIGKITADPVNFVDFKVSADGRPVSFKTEQKAMHAGRDVTAMVKAAGLPVNVVSGQNYQRFDKITPAQRKILKDADVAEFDGNQGIAKWIVQTRFYWMQHFPAHKTVIIEHSYKPVTGQAFFSEHDLKAAPGSKDDYWKKKYCMDAGTVAKLRALLAAHKSENMLNASSTQFVLKTANNWQGGIGKFHLAIDKLKPGNVLSLCWDGALKKSGTTSFEFTAADFRPPRDLSFVVIGAP